VLSLITCLLVAPMCLQQDLSGFRHFSYVGVASCVLIVTFMLLRVFDGTYASGGMYAQENEQMKEAKSVSFWNLDVGSCVLIASLSLSYTAHATAPQFASQLKAFSKSRFGSLVFWSYAISSVIYLTAMYAGFLLFGFSSKGDVLENFSPADRFASVAQFLIGFSVLGSTPIFFNSFREAVASRLDGLMEINFSALTLILLFMLTVISAFVTDVGFIVPMIGSATDGPLKFFLPPLVLWKLREGNPNVGGFGHAVVVLNYFLFGFGIFLTTFGAYMTYLNTYTTSLN